MARLNKPHVLTLSRANFIEFPLWVWDDGNEGYLPISDAKYTSEYGTLFVKASFKSDNHTFDGYLVGDQSFYAFFLFVNDKDFAFNVNLSSFVEKTLLEIFEELNSETFKMFPLKYISPISYENGLPISGNFVITNGKLSCVPDKSSFE